MACIEDLPAKRSYCNCIGWLSCHPCDTMQNANPFPVQSVWNAYYINSLEGNNLACPEFFWEVRKYPNLWDLQQDSKLS